MDIRTILFFSETSVKISKLGISMLCNAERMDWAKTDVDTFTLKGQKLWYWRKKKWDKIRSLPFLTWDENVEFPWAKRHRGTFRRIRWHRPLHSARRWPKYSWVCSPFDTDVENQANYNLGTCLQGRLTKDPKRVIVVLCNSANGIKARKAKNYLTYGYIRCIVTFPELLHITS